MQFLLRMHTDIYTHIDTHFFSPFFLKIHIPTNMHGFAPEWLVWDSNGDSYKNIGTCCGTETAAERNSGRCCARSSRITLAWTNSITASITQVYTAQEKALCRTAVYPAPLCPTHCFPWLQSKEGVKTRQRGEKRELHAGKTWSLSVSKSPSLS